MYSGKVDDNGVEHNGRERAWPLEDKLEVEMEGSRTDERRKDFLRKWRF